MNTNLVIIHTRAVLQSLQGVNLEKPVSDLLINDDIMNGNLENGDWCYPAAGSCLLLRD